MLFANHAQQLTASINGIQSRIDELEALLKALRNDKSQLEAELQQILTLEGAAESAINQAQSFISAASSLGRNDLISTFWTAMDAMKNPTTPQLAGSEPEAEPETEPVEPDAPETITVEAVEPAPEITEPAPDTEPTPENQPETEPEITEPETLNGNRPKLQSVGSAAFDPETASFSHLKSWVRAHQPDDETRKHGKLSHRDTWETAANQILNPNS